MSLRYTPEEADRLLQEQKAKMEPASQYKPDDGPESTLSKKIRGYCKDHGYPAQINRQSRKARGMLEPGWPDVTMCIHGKVLFFELKAGKGKLSEDQIRIKLQFLSLKQNWFEVRSFRQFIDIVEALK